MHNNRQFWRMRGLQDSNENYLTHRLILTETWPCVYGKAYMRFVDQSRIFMSTFLDNDRKKQ